MKEPTTIHDHHELLSSLQILPRKILLLHGQDNIPEFILHHLCHKNCFNIHKAAYFVDNPDFNCLQGIVGIDHSENCFEGDIWDNKELFSKQMQASLFNKKVRSIKNKSYAKDGLHCSKECIHFLTKELGMHKPRLFSWNMKYDNHGILVIEEEDDNRVFDENYLLNSACLLGFCPIY